MRSWLTFGLAIVLATSIVRAQPCETRAWVRVPGNSPGPQPGMCSMAFDETIGEVVCLVGYEFWSWNGALWTFRGYPPDPFVQAIAFDSARQNLVAFGQNGKTWTWSGGVWSLRANSGPVNRMYTTMSYDPFRARVVIFGGYLSPNVILSDTWEWSGVLWIQRQVDAQRPTCFHSMAFDSATSQTMLFGGTSNPSGFFGTASGETWAWNGHVWTQREFGPGPRVGSSMTSDPSRGRVVLYGGNRPDFSPGPGTYLDDTWEYDGTEWIPITNLGPGPRFQPGLAYDPLRQCVVLYGGAVTGTIDLYDVWEYRFIDGVQVLEQPASDLVASGALATLTVNVAGDGSLSYRWRFEGQELVDDGRIAGSDTPTLSIFGASPDDIGDYDCVISNPCSTLTTTKARLVVTAQPCPGDTDANGLVEFADITAALKNWGAACP